MSTMSLGEFERQHGVNRGTVQKRAQDMGYKTSDGLSEEAVDRLLAYYKLGPYAPEQRPQQPMETGIGQYVVKAEVVGLPTPGLTKYQLDAPLALTESYEDPMAIALKFLNFGDELIGALDEQTQLLEKRAADTRLAARLVADKTNRVASAQRTAQIKDAVASAFLERDMADLTRLARVDDGPASAQ